MRFFFSGPRIFGIRPGIILDPNSLDVRPMAPAGAVTGGFVYVITGPPGRIKIGQSGNPRKRLAELQTACPYPLELAYVAVSPGSTYCEIENAAHAILNRHRVMREWFAVETAVAVAAINAAAHKLGYPLQPLTPDMADAAVKIAAEEAAGYVAPPPTLPVRLLGNHAEFKAVAILVGVIWCAIMVAYAVNH